MRTIKLLLSLTSVIILAWILPWLWRLATDTPATYPFTYYSSVSESFGIRKMEGNEVILTDSKGNRYNQAQFDSILPMIYYPQLAREGNLPDSLHGFAINQRNISRNNFYFRYRPSTKNRPTIPLYTLFESMPKRVDLEMPGDMFRLTNHIQFIKPETNTINHRKSKRFDEALKNAGFHGPAKLIAGNPTTRKPYDEGYFITDAKNTLFHLKMVNNRPYVARIDLPNAFTPVWIKVTEYPSRKFYAFILSEKGKLFSVFTQGYDVKQIPVPAFNPDSDNLLIMGNMFNWNVEVTTKHDQTVYAVDAESLALVDSKTFKAPSKNHLVYNSLFAFSLEFSSPNDEYIAPRVTFTGFGYLLSSGILMLVYFLLRRRQKKTMSVESSLLIIATGIFGFISTLAFGDSV
jgi:hypothetical protein